MDTRTSGATNARSCERLCINIADSHRLTTARMRGSALPEGGSPKQPPRMVAITIKTAVNMHRLLKSNLPLASYVTPCAVAAPPRNHPLSYQGRIGFPRALVRPAVGPCAEQPPKDKSNAKHLPTLFFRFEWRS